MNEHYSAVLADLRNRRVHLESELRDVDAAIAGLQRLMGTATATQEAPAGFVSMYQRAFVDPSARQRFAKMSVRWGVLWHLAEFSQDYEKTGQIAEALLDGGYQPGQSGGTSRFGNMVSAVLSNMKAKGEVETNEDGGYRVTPQGRQTWAAIRQGAKFRAATSASGQTLLSEQ